MTRRRLRSGTVVLGGAGLLASELVSGRGDPDERCAARAHTVPATGPCKDTGGPGRAPAGASARGSRPGVERGGFGRAGGHRTSGG